MDEFGEDLVFVSEAYRQAFHATGNTERAFDAVLEQYCKRKGGPRDLATEVNVGVLVAEAQMRQCRSTTGARTPPKRLAPATGLGAGGLPVDG